MRSSIFCVLASIFLVSAIRVQAADGVPVFKVTPVESSVTFDVEASVAIKGKFEKWDASLTFTSPDVSSGVLDIKIQADSVDTGSGMKNNKLKGKDFFDVNQNPAITFHSTKIVQTGPDTFEVDGTFTIRGVSKAEKLTLKVEGAGTGSGTISGTMAIRDPVRLLFREPTHRPTSIIFSRACPQISSCDARRRRRSETLRQYCPYLALTECNSFCES